MAECERCRDWGKYERHEDHAPTRLTPQPFTGCPHCGAPVSANRTSWRCANGHGTAPATDPQ